MEGWKGFEKGTEKKKKGRGLGYVCDFVHSSASQKSPRWHAAAEAGFFLFPRYFSSLRRALFFFPPLALARTRRRRIKKIEEERENQGKRKKSDRASLQGGLSRKKAKDHKKSDG
jgi:hypothetical protein